MNQTQLTFFAGLIREQKAETVQEIEETKERLGSPPESNDEADRAQYEEESALLIRMVDRKRRLLPKFDDALKRIRSGDYGYCLETGDRIGLRRLLVRPTAEYSVDAKAINEFREKHYKSS